ASLTGAGRVVAGVPPTVDTPPSRSRRPTSPAAVEARAIAPAWIRKPRRDQSGVTASTGPPASVNPAPAVRSRNDITWMPAIAATTATTSEVVGVADGIRSVATKPAIAKA